MKHVKGTSERIPCMMTSLRWMVHTTSYSQKCQGGTDMCSYGSAPFMAIVMVLHYYWWGGHKDPFSSLFKYCQEMPEHIYFIACQLFEYCLSREPELFKHTQFWHDLFHLVGHVCGINFKSGRVLGLKGVDSKICEEITPTCNVSSI